MNELTAKQRYAVDVEDSALVSAAAGSGKTRVMTEKVVKLISEGADIRDMAIMTYTSAAAAEMKSRIYRQLLYSESDDPRLKQQADLVAVAKIGTCHNFCIKILRENYDLAGLSYNFTVLPKEIADSLKERASIDIMTERLNDGDKDMEAFLRRYVRRMSKKDLAGAISKTVFDAPDAHPVPEEWLDECAAFTEEEYSELCEGADISGDYAHTMPDTIFLVSLAKDIRQRYSELKKELGGVDYGEILTRAYSVLKQRRDKDKSITFSYVFVDEFQDSNPIQKEIIDLISENNKVFYVGDVKQCVYAFNQADPDIFNAVADEYRSGKGSLVTMNENFRSSAAVIDAVNHVMGSVMSKDVGGVEYSDSECLIAKSKNSGETGLLICAKGGETDPQFDMIADRIASLAGSMMHIGDEDRAVKYGDIAVLMRNKTHAKGLTESLGRRNIPFITNFDERYPSRCADLFVSILKAVEDGGCDLAVLTAMKYRGEGFSDNDLARIRAALKEVSFTAAVSAYMDEHEDELSSRLRAFTDKLQRLRVYFAAYSLETSLFHLAEEFELFDYAKIKSDEEFKAVIELIDVITTCGERTLTGIIGFLDDLKEQKGAYVHLSSSKRPDAVNVMTMHRSKGLEFPIVFLASLETKFNKKDMQKNTVFVADRDFGILPLYIDKKKRLKRNTVMRDFYAEKKSEGLVSEELRLLYVAMTRAMCSLYMCMSVPYDDAKSLNDNIEELVAGAEGGYNRMMDFILAAYASDLETSGRVMPAEITDDVRNLSAAEERIATTLDDIVKGERRDWITFTPGSMAPAKTSVSALKKEKRKGIVFRPRLFEDSGPVSASDFGTLVHSVMMKCVPDGDPEKVLKAMKDSYLIKDDEYKKIMDFMPNIKEFLSSDIAGRMAASGRLLKEVPFSINIDASGIEGLATPLGEGETLLQGVIDAAFEEDGGWVIVDYKTDRVTDENREELTESYAFQLQAYAKALSDILNAGVKEKYIVFLRTGETVTV